MFKRCNRCGETKAEDEFHRWKKSADGRRSSCKSCRASDSKTDVARELRKARYQRNKDVVKARQRAYVDANRQDVNARARDRYAADPEPVRAANRRSAAKHKARVSASNKAYRAEHSERLKVADRAYGIEHRPERNAYERAWRQRNPDKVQASRHARRARKRAGGRFTHAEWRNLCDFYGNYCLCCGCVDVKLTPDHVVPLCAGGSNTIANIQPLCLQCNIDKGRRTTDHRSRMPEWAQPANDIVVAVA